MSPGGLCRVSPAWPGQRQRREREEGGGRRGRLGSLTGERLALETHSVNIIYYAVTLHTRTPPGINWWLIIRSPSSASGIKVGGVFRSSFC